MRIRTCLFAFLVSALLRGTAADADTTTHETTWQGVKRSYIVHMPPSVETSSPRPLLVLLHGSGRRGKVMIDEWHKLADQQGFILLAPDSIDPRSWQGPFDGPGFLRKIVDEVCQAHAIDKSRIYLFGHSSGGHFALIMGLMESEYFAAVAVHAGAIPSSSESFVSVATRKIPFAIWAGDRDRAVPSAEVRRTADLLERNQFPVRLSLLPRHDHDYYAISAKVNAEAWAFLSAHSLEKPPLYVDHGDRDDATPKGTT